MSDEVAKLAAKLELVTKRLQTLEDVQEIRKTQFNIDMVKEKVIGVGSNVIGYYIDKCLYEQAVQLFANDPRTRAHFHGGIWHGKEGARRLYIERFQKTFTGGKNGPVHGFLLDHPMYQDIIDVSDDGKYAKARFRVNMQAGLHESAVCNDPNHRDYKPRQWWEGAIYENEYIKENGKWKMFVMKYRPQWHATFEDGWAHTPREFVPFVSRTLADGDPSGPDELEKVTLWPDTPVFPFHYENPEGGWLTEAEMAAPPKVYRPGDTGRVKTYFQWHSAAALDVIEIVASYHNSALANVLTDYDPRWPHSNRHCRGSWLQFKSVPLIDGWEGIEKACFNRKRRDSVMVNSTPFEGYKDEHVTIDTILKEVLIRNIIFEGTKQIPFDNVQSITRLTKLTIFNSKSWAIEPLNWVSWSRGFFREVGGWRIPPHVTAVVLKACHTPMGLKYGFSVDNWDEFRRVVETCMPNVKILTK